METHRRSLKFSLLLLLPLLLSACATAGKQAVTESTASGSASAPTETPKPFGPPGPAETYGPPIAEPTSVYGPEPIRSRGFVVVLGPGMARGLASVGVLRGLQDEKIPIHAIYGTEMGALVGALYSTRKNFNQMEWDLQKFRTEDFVPGHGLLSEVFSGNQSGKKLKEKFEKLFPATTVQKIDLHVGATNPADQQPILLTEGMLADRLFQSFSASCAAVRPFFVNEAVDSQAGPVLVVDNATDPSELRFPEVKKADLILRPELGTMDPNNFDQKQQIMFLGRKAVQDHLPEIRRAAGLSAAGGQQP